MRIALLVLLASCTGCVFCADTDELCLVAEERTDAILSVRATADDDVWLVGTEMDPESSGPSARHWDGSGWTALDLSEHAGAELWWVYPTAERVTMVGSQGLILEYDPASGETTAQDGPDPEVNFFGVWGAGPDDVWAVGGAVTSGDQPALWRRDADGWAEFTDPNFSGSPDGSLYFKVHGTAADDVWIVGDTGQLLHWDGTGLTATDPPDGMETARFLTIDAGGDEPIAVGGLGSGMIVHWDGSAWIDRTPEFAPGVNGVCVGAGRTHAVGGQGSLHTWTGSEWESSLTPLTFQDYHGCAVSPGGELWAVGGQISSRPLTEGVVAFEGERGIRKIP